MIRFNAMVKWCVLTAFAVGLSACGADSGREEASQGGNEAPAANVEQPDSVGDHQLLNAFVVKGEQYRFYGRSEGKEILITGLQSAYATDNLYLALTRENPDLTSLEVFYALAPEGEVPHELLLAVHEDEARARGRADTSVRHVSFDKTRVIEKAAAACQTDVFNNAATKLPSGTWVNKAGFDYTSGTHSVESPANGLLNTTEIALVGVCNYSGATATLNWKIEYDLVTAPWGPAFTLATGWLWWGAKLKTPGNFGAAFARASTTGAYSMVSAERW